MNVADTWAAIRAQFSDAAVASRAARKAAAKRGRPCRFPDIQGAADSLGVTRTHLFLVLSGKRRSERLLSQLRAIGHPLAQQVGTRRKAS